MAAAQISPVFLYCNKAYEKRAIKMEWECWLQIDTDLDLHLRIDDSHSTRISGCCKEWVVADWGTDYTQRFYVCSKCKKKVVPLGEKIYKTYSPPTHGLDVYFSQLKLGAYKVASASLALDMALENLPGEMNLGAYLQSWQEWLSAITQGEGQRAALALGDGEVERWKEFEPLTLF